MQVDQPISAEEWERRGIEADRTGRHAEAEACFAQAVADDESRSISWVGLAFSQIHQRRMDDAVISLERARAARPDCGIVAHLFNAASGGISSRAPNDYVAFVFNGYAGNFDSHLAQLQYQGPQMLARVAERAGWVADGTRRIIDLGCGTGLSGLPFRAYAAHLEGADLAAGMLTEAQKRGIYNHLWQGEIHTVLRRLPAETYDAVIAADTLIYVGELQELFRLAHAVLKPGGSLLFTVERCDSGFRLAKSGRYQHSDSYLRQCADGLFEYVAHLDGTLRTEQAQPILGSAQCFRKP